MAFVQPNGLLIDVETPLRTKIYHIRRVAEAISVYLHRMSSRDYGMRVSACRDLIDFCNETSVIPYAKCLTAFHNDLSKPERFLITPALLNDPASNTDGESVKKIGEFAFVLNFKLREDLKNISEFEYYIENIDDILKDEHNFLHSATVDHSNDVLYEFPRLHAHNSFDISHQMHLSHVQREEFQKHILYQTHQYHTLLLQTKGQLKNILGESGYQRKLVEINHFLQNDSESGEEAAYHEQYF